MVPTPLSDSAIAAAGPTPGLDISASEILGRLRAVGTAVLRLSYTSCGRRGADTSRSPSPRDPPMLTGVLGKGRARHAHHVGWNRLLPVDKILVAHVPARL